jgi:flavin reductase (DIM6/NTAB) family NADH-FMN oxidoreductase RutF
MGTHSGRDGDKAETLGLHVAYTENGAPYYLEAKEVFECEIIYRDQFDSAGFEELPRKRYENFPAGIHHVYIGKILSAKRK